jgi:MFS family permease
MAMWADRSNRRNIITLALTMWSGMTVLCGMAANFWQLALARIGVGVGGLDRALLRIPLLPICMPQRSGQRLWACSPWGLIADC